MRSLMAPRFRRLTCARCGIIIPWSWFSTTPKRAAMSVDANGKVTARCLSHLEPEVRIQ